MSEKQINQIRVPFGNTAKLAKVFGVTSSYVSQCLNGKKGNADKAKRIRHTALTQYDGKELVDVKSIKQMKGKQPTISN